MSIDDWDASEIRATCPRCGSEDVAVEVDGGYFCVTQCHKCGYKVKGSCFSVSSVA